MVTEQQELQALFDISFNHIIAQGGASFMADTGSCQYRMPNGRSCAAAPFILEYDRKMEDRNWSALVENQHFINKLDPLAVKHRSFVGALQSIHDDAASINEDGEDIYAYIHLHELDDNEFMKIYIKSAHKLANRHNLKFTEPGA